MSWNYNTSLSRVETHLQGMGEIEVEKLVRDADLHNLLSETCCRDIYGAHVYLDIPNFADLATMTAEGEDYRRVIQALHIYEREVARIVEEENIFDGVRIHFQGAKLHALFFRPIDDSEEIAARAVLLQAVVRHFVCCIFNTEFPKLPNLSVSGGAALGNAIGTKNGHRGDRELLFLGAPANYAAKILTGTDTLRISSVPASTIPNRLFAHAASSGGSLTQDAIKAPFSAHTIFEDIDKDPIDLNTTYRIYTSQSSILLANGYLMLNQDKFFDIGDFAQDCKNNDIPQYTFIEPIYDGVNANSQHPDFAIDKGEALIGQVYNAIRDSPLWTDTLLLIVYDEHGGLYDHVFPPSLQNNTGLPDFPATSDFGFTFNRLGVRVPAVFVSPWLQPGTILPQQFNHCSIVKTVRQLCCKSQTPFNWRESIATSFLNIVDVNDGPMRTDKPILPPVVSSDGTMALQGRNRLLSASARGLQQPLPAVLPTVSALAKTTRTPNIPPVIPPALRKPTDLVTLMAQSMEYSLSQKGVRLSKTSQQIYSAQDADAYLAEARTAIAKLGGA